MGKNTQREGAPVRGKTFLFRASEATSSTAVHATAHRSGRCPPAHSVPAREALAPRGTKQPQRNCCRLSTVATYPFS